MVPGYNMVIATFCHFPDLPFLEYAFKLVGIISISYCRLHPRYLYILAPAVFTMSHLITFLRHVLWIVVIEMFG